MSQEYFININFQLTTESGERPTEEEIIQELKSQIINDETLSANYEIEMVE